jgi:uncharacterized protein YggE
MNFPRNILIIATLLTTTWTSGDSALAETPQPSISVTGECLKQITRDRGATIVSSSVVATTAREASQKAVQQHEKIKTDIKALKLADMVTSTVQYTVNQECDYSKTSGKACSGYRATLSTRFETPNIQDLEEVITISAKNGAEDVSQLETFVSPATMKAERESCLDIATKNARAKAEKIASGAGVTLGKPLSINETGESQEYMPRFAQTRAFAAEGKSATISIDAAPFDLKVSVSATYAIQ